MEGPNNMNPITDASEVVDLYFSCKKLIDADTFSKSDPYIKLYEIQQSGNLQLMGMTEVIQDNLNPDFETAIKIEYFFEKDQKMRAEIWDCDDIKTRKGDFLGFAEFSLGEVLGSMYNLKVYEIFRKKQKGGRLIARVEQENDLQKFKMNFNAIVNSIPNTGWFSSKVTFIEIWKKRITKGQRSQLAEIDGNFNTISNDDWQLVYRSQQIQGDNTQYYLKDLRSSKICDNDFNLPLKVVLMKYKNNGSHYAMGEASFTLSALLGGNVELTFQVIKKLKKKTLPTIKFGQFTKKDVFEFTDFLKGGLNLTQFIGIDFTGSNGNPNVPTSLHFINPNKTNHYQRAILSIGEILGKYNKSGVIPCYGFGARIDGQPTSFDFPLNLNPQAPFLRNYGEMFQAYQNIFSRITLSGPTNFAPLLKQIIEYTRKNMEVSPMNYTVYVILTDGAISDMEDTMREIVIASRLPLSIIIIGKKSS